jgi:collagen type III alpha
MIEALILPTTRAEWQGAYQDEWIRSNLSKEDKKAGHGAYLPPVPTRAVLGHAIGAQKYLQPHHGGEEWKMKKFTRVGERQTAVGREG